ncbi:MAG: hypothetical protein RLZZ210_642 [Pseudomonadota bacterium]|jgi:predicted transposase/invertase (TIGR01784 family)
MELKMSKYINPFTDYGFKKLFGEDNTRIYLIDFLNSVLEGHIPQIIEIQHRRTEMLGRHDTDRNSVFDLYCTTQNGERIIIELQKVEQKYFKDRSLYYSTFAVQEQNQKGKIDSKSWDFKLYPVYCVGILNFDFSDKKKYLHVGRILDIEDNDLLMPNLNFAFIEMPKFEKDIKSCKTKQEKWLYTLQNLSYLQEIPKELEEEIFLEFFHLAEISALKGEERGMYEDSLKYYRDIHIIETQNLEKGLEQGERKKAVEIAKSMKNEGLDNNLIIKLTGLTQEEIDKL